MAPTRSGTRGKTNASRNVLGDVRVVERAGNALYGARVYVKLGRRLDLSLACSAARRSSCSYGLVSISVGKSQRVSSLGPI
jgi:hypothetical protein